MSTVGTIKTCMMAGCRSVAMREGDYCARCAPCIEPLATMSGFHVNEPACIHPGCGLPAVELIAWARAFVPIDVDPRSREATVGGDPVVDLDHMFLELASPGEVRARCISGHEWEVMLKPEQPTISVEYNGPWNFGTENVD